jgi:hypothetical protein
MAGGAQQQHPVATDPKKAADGQIYKGDAKGEGHDDFQKAREGMNAKLRDKQAADAAADQKKIADGQKLAKIDGQADAIVKGLDLKKIAQEVDQDFQMAEKLRSFRVLSPENKTKLEQLKANVTARRNKRIEAILNDPDLNKEIDTALAAGAKPQAPAQQPQGGPAQQPAAVQKPAEGVPNAAIQQPQQPAQPQQQMDMNALLDDKLGKIKQEFTDKFKKQDDELAQERIRRQEAEKKMRDMENAEKTRANTETRNQFNTNAKKLGVPEDLLDVAFGTASEIVNANQRQMTWEEIFAAMKEHRPSLFRTPAKGGDGKPAGTGTEPAAGEGGTQPRKVTVKAGTGTDAGGKVAGKNPPATTEKKEHESFADARKALSKRAETMGAGSA